MIAKTLVCISKCILVIRGVSVPRGPWLTLRKRWNKGNSPEKRISQQGLKTKAYPGGGRWWENLADQQDTGFHQSQIKNLKDFVAWHLKGVILQFVAKWKDLGQEEAFLSSLLSTRRDSSGMRVLGSHFVDCLHCGDVCIGNTCPRAAWESSYPSIAQICSQW